MIPFTAAQREALRLLVGISPETHPIYFPLRPCKVCERSIVSAQGFSGGLCSCGQFRLAEGKSNCLPCPLTGGDAADRVWLVDLMAWLVSVDRAHGVGPSFYKEPERAWAANFYHGCFPEYGATATAALLHSCRAAGVPEVVAIFDMEKETSE